MTDREYLEFAAKAAGYWAAEFNCPANLPHKNWNPLTDDGDALRLAVKLRLIVDPVATPLDGSEPAAAVMAPGSKHYIKETFGSDPYAATRRAIVRAAAEIGKGLA